jgi:phosphate transport system substrate-binding protein
MRFKLLALSALIVALLVACGGAADTEPEVITETVQVEVTRVVTETQTETVVETVTETETVVETVEVLALPAVDPLAVEGDVVSAGSSTVFPLTEAWPSCSATKATRATSPSTPSALALGWNASASPVKPTWPTPAVRSTTEEIESCEAIGRTPIEFRVGTDALAITVSAENDFATDMTLEELALIFSTAETWADVTSRMAR